MTPPESLSGSPSTYLLKYSRGQRRHMSSELALIGTMSGSSLSRLTGGRRSRRCRGTRRTRARAAALAWPRARITSIRSCSQSVISGMTAAVSMSSSSYVPRTRSATATRTDPAASQSVAAQQREAHGRSVRRRAGRRRVTSKLSSRISGSPSASVNASPPGPTSRRSPGMSVPHWSSSTTRTGRVKSVTYQRVASS